MAQQCTIQEQQKPEQLKVAAENYWSRKYWEKYCALCKLDRIKPKKLLQEVSYYEHLDKIEPKQVVGAIIEEIKVMYLKAMEEDPHERVRIALEKNPKLREKTCGNCQGNRIMFVNGKSRDCGTLGFPTGAYHNGYFPWIPNLCDGDYINMNICLDCGFLVGFDKQKFNEQVLKAEFFGHLDMTTDTLDLH